MALVLAGCTASDPPWNNLDGWRELSPAQVQALAEAQRKSGLGSFRSTYSVVADFDGDGSEDRAAILTDDGFEKYVLVIQRAAGGKPYRADIVGKASELTNIDLSLVSPGEYPTACGKGMGEERNCVPKIKLRSPGVSFAYIESSEMMVFWNGRRFEEAWTSD